MKKILLYTALLLTITLIFIYTSHMKNNTPNEALKDAEIKSKHIIVWDKTLSYKQGSADYATVIAPSFFVLECSEDSFYLKELSDDIKEYSKNCDKDIWAMYTNGFNPDNTRAVLTDDKKRNELVKSISDSAKKYGFEGVNIDFENMYSEDKDYFSVFIKELSDQLHKNNIILSVDVTKINKGSLFYSMCYDRKKLCEYADYIILMAYDQFPRTSKTAGPVSSIPWTEDAINGILEEVPKEKLILGIPFYTRKWETKDGEVVNCPAVSMDETLSLANVNNSKIIEDKETQLNYFEFIENEHLVKIWLEDESSVLKRCNLASKFNLAGLACWSLGYESESVKEVLKKYQNSDI